MAQTITLAQLREQVGYAADVIIGEDRYPSPMINSWINLAIQNYQVLRRQAGTADQAVTTLTSSGSTTPGAGGFPANETLTLPADFQSLVSIYSNVNSGGKYQLEALSEVDRVQGTFGVASGTPTHYSILDSTSTGPARVKLWPPASGAMTFEVTYVPEPATLVADGDTWEYAPGTLDLVVCEVAGKVLDRDGIPESQQYQALQQRMMRAELALRRFQLRDPGVLSMRNTRAVNSANRRRNWPYQ